MNTPELQTIKDRQKAMWKSGDFGEIAKTIMPIAEEFMARLPLCPGMRVLDVACGSGGPSNALGSGVGSPRVRSACTCAISFCAS